MVETLRANIDGKFAFLKGWVRSVSVKFCRRRGRPHKPFLHIQIDQLCCWQYSQKETL